LDIWSQLEAHLTQFQKGENALAPLAEQAFLKQVRVFKNNLYHKENTQEDKKEDEDNIKQEDNKQEDIKKQDNINNKQKELSSRLIFHVNIGGGSDITVDNTCKASYESKEWFYLVQEGALKANKNDIPYSKNNPISKLLL
jgi:hypothetical protein